MHGPTNEKPIKAHKVIGSLDRGKHFVSDGRFCTTFISFSLELNKLEIKFP